jgi:hypothetical protein
LIEKKAFSGRAQLSARYVSVRPAGGTPRRSVQRIGWDPAGTDRFTISGTDRIVGEDREEDFEINVVRRPPATSFKSK